MIHLSDPAAYHDKRFKNNPAKRKTMKTKMPEPVAARVWIGRMEDLVLDYLYSDQGDGEPLFTESQLKAAMVAAWNEAIEEAALVCRDMKQECGEPDSMQACLNRQMMSCSDAILKLKETP